MRIQLFVNKDAIHANHPDLIWVLMTPGKTIYARIVIIDCIGVSVFNPDPNVRPNAWLEFDGELREGERGEYAIVPKSDGQPKR